MADVGGLKVYTINKADLEPGTTYVVRVKTYTDRSEKFSDSSEELEFTTCKFHILCSIVFICISAVS